MLMIENNLRAMIAQYLRNNPEESHKTIAAKKGVRPETVSRHSHDKIDMSMQDINDYSKILGCTTFDIMYKSQPMPIVAIASCEKYDDPISYTHALTPATAECLYVHGMQQKNLSASWFKLPQDYQGPFKSFDGCFEIWDATPCLTNTISKDALMKPCVVRTVEEELIGGILFPQPGSHKYSIVQNFGAKPNIKTDLEPEWAAPIISYVMHPEMMGASVVKSSQNAYALERSELMYKYMNERRKRKGMQTL